MGVTNTPLRYPGGKSVLSPLLADFIVKNGLSDGVYVEPYAGGAGAALNLLFSEYISKVMLNDADRAVFLFWKSVLFQTDAFVKLVCDTPINLACWKRQRFVFRNQPKFSDLRVGFSAFYLNRCNRSGILYAGPIGGQLQSGSWGIDARFNKSNLIRKIERIALYNSRISIHNLDGIEFLETQVRPISLREDKMMVYLDPPYFSKGDQLYMNHYSEEDHELLSSYMGKQSSFKWIISYDDVPEVHRLYRKRVRKVISLNYFAHRARVGREVMIFCPHCILPDAQVLGRQFAGQLPRTPDTIHLSGAQGK